MAHVVRSVRVACPPERVFAVLSHIERLPEFSDLTVAVRKGPNRPLQAGDRFEQVVKLLGVEISSEWEVVEVERNRLIRVEGRADGESRATITDRIRPDGEGCEVTLDVDYELPLGALGGLADRLVVEGRTEQDAERILARLKELCETSTA